MAKIIMRGKPIREGDPWLYQSSVIGPVMKFPKKNKKNKVK